MRTVKIAAQFRPFTSTLSPSVVSCIECATPMHAEEHLVQGWGALAEAGQEEDPVRFARQMAFARARLDGARATLARVRPRRAKAVAEEVEHFARLIEATR